MSGHSDVTTCPNCGGENMNICCDYKPFDQVSGTCMDCGFFYYTEVKQMTLKVLNSEREEYDLEPLKRRKKSKLDF